MVMMVIINEDKNEEMQVPVECILYCTRYLLVRDVVAS